MLFRLLLLAAALAAAFSGATAQDVPSPPAAAAVEVAVHVAEDAVIDSQLEAEERGRSVESTGTQLRKEIGDGLARLKDTLNALGRQGRGPWQVEAVILEWIDPSALRGAFGLGVPGIAIEARLFDRASSDRVAVALAEFPPAAERLESEKTKRVLAPEDAAKRVAEWAAPRIGVALDPQRPKPQGKRHE